MVVLSLLFPAAAFGGLNCGISWLEVLQEMQQYHTMQLAPAPRMASGMCNEFSRGCHSCSDPPVPLLTPAAHLGLPHQCHLCLPSFNLSDDDSHGSVDVGKTEYVPPVPKLPIFPTFPFPAARQSSRERSPWKIALKSAQNQKIFWFSYPVAKSSPLSAFQRQSARLCFPESSLNSRRGGGAARLLYLPLSPGPTRALCWR